MIALDYFYRDADGNKSWGKAVFGNKQRLSLGVVDRALRYCMIGGQFIASQVKIEEVFFETVIPGDSCWHEYWAVRSTSNPINDPDERDINQVIMDFRFAANTGWEEFQRSPSKEAYGLYQTAMV